MAFQRHVPAATDEDGLQIFSVVPIANVIRLARDDERVMLSSDVGRLEIGVVTSDRVLPIARVT